MEQQNFNFFQDGKSLHGGSQDASSKITPDNTKISRHVKTGSTSPFNRGPETHLPEPSALNHLSELFDSVISYNVQDISALKTSECIYEQVVQNEQRQFFQPIRAKVEFFLVGYFSYMRFFRSTLSCLKNQNAKPGAELLKSLSLLQPKELDEPKELDAFQVDSSPGHIDNVRETSLELHERLTKVLKENDKLREVIQELTRQAERLELEILNSFEKGSGSGTAQKCVEEEGIDRANKNQEVHQGEQEPSTQPGRGYLEYQQGYKNFQEQVIGSSSPQGTTSRVQTSSISQNKNLEVLLELKKMVLHQQKIQELKDDELNQLKRANIALEDQNIKLSEQNLDYEEQIENLKSQLNTMREMHAEFKSMSEHKAALEEENKELRLTLEEMNILKELSDDLEKVYISSEQMLKDELRQQQAKIKMYQYQINILNLKLSSQNILDPQELQLGPTSKSDTLGVEDFLTTQLEKDYLSESLSSKIYGKKTLCTSFDILKKQFKKISYAQTIEALNFYQFFVPVDLIQKDLKFFFCSTLIKWFRESCTLLSNHMVSLFHPSLFEQLSMPTSGDEESSHKPIIDSVFSSWVLIPLLVNIRQNASKLLQATKHIGDDESYLRYSNLCTEVLPCKKILDDLAESFQQGESPVDQQIEDVKSVHIRLDFLAQTICSDSLALPVGEQCFDQFSRLFVSVQSLIFEAIKLKRVYTDKNPADDTSFQLWLGFPQSDSLIAYLKELIANVCKLRQMSLARQDCFQGLEFIDGKIGAIISITNRANKCLSELRLELEKQMKPSQEMNRIISVHNEVVSELKKLDLTNALLSKQVADTSEEKAVESMRDVFLQVSKFLSSIEEQIASNYFSTTNACENLPRPGLRKTEAVQRHSDLGLQVTRPKRDLSDKDGTITGQSENVQDFERGIEKQVHGTNGQVGKESDLYEASSQPDEASSLKSLNDVLKSQVENLGSQISQYQAEQRVLFARMSDMERDLQISLEAQKNSESMKCNLHRSLTSLRYTVKYLLQKLRRAAEKESWKILEEELPPLLTGISQEPSSFANIPLQSAPGNAEDADNLTHSENQNGDGQTLSGNQCGLGRSSNKNSSNIRAIRHQLVDTVQTFNSLAVFPCVVDLSIRDPTPQQQLEAQALKLLQVKASMLNLKTRIGRLFQPQKQTSPRSTFAKFNMFVSESSRASPRSKPVAVIKFPRVSTGDRGSPPFTSRSHNTLIRTYVTNDSLRELHLELIY
ncbi:uncharacterized protein LOC126304734 [Schistocerca gregaria]|uniref:uncharacterized protein LOC126304734 n=1 Tax=Schistocerca gregaria TaxID=7010 RepID=UPI00211E8352|nr:uncharacterized protein LOC126304734 [Schistocerca gregaria]